MDSYQICAGRNADETYVTITKRVVNSMNLNALKNDISNFNWDEVKNCADVYAAYGYFIDNLMTIYNNFPLQTTIRKRLDVVKPYIDNYIKN